jgi:hypothetical protein
LTNSESSGVFDRRPGYGERDGLGLVKVAFALTASDWYSYAIETMWALPLGSGSFVLRNVPFYTNGISFDDQFAAEVIDRALAFRVVTRRGGHSTYRIITYEGNDTPKFSAAWRPLAVIGCTYERADGHLIGVDVPPTADIHDVYRLLEAGAAAETWDFEESHVGHPLEQ